MKRKDEIMKNPSMRKFDKLSAEERYVRENGWLEFMTEKESRTS
jgi:hypothetical protein